LEPWQWELAKWAMSIGYTAFLVLLGWRFGTDEETAPSEWY
jgi:hypothetical protein